MRGVFAVLVALLCLLPTPARAYDGDTHYAWTYYLAIHVGYSPRQAYQIASAAWAIDHDAQTGPLHATAWDSVSGEPSPVIERVWRRFHAFADAVYVGERPDVGAVSERRREGEETLAAIGERQRNIGAQIHYLQDYFAHNEYDSVRGHAVWGHAPDRIGHGPNRARQMTKRTLAALNAFAPSVGVEARAVDETRLWVVLDRLIQANPPLLQIDPANYDLVWDALADLDLNLVRGLTVGIARGMVSDEKFRALLDAAALPTTIKSVSGINKIAWGDVDLDAAVDIVNAALIEDAEVGRVRRFPPGWSLPRQWIQYDFDADGAATAEAVARKHFALDHPKVTFGEAKVSFRRDPSSASLYEVTVQQPYSIEGMATLPAFRAIPLVERSLFSDDSEQMQRDRDGTNGTFVMERKVFRPRAALLDGSLKWRSSIDLFGDDPFAAPEVPIRLGADAEWYVVRMNATGYDLRGEGGVRTDAGGASADPRSGLHRRRGRMDLVIVKVERGGTVAATLADIRKIVAEPHCRRASSIAPSAVIESPGASLAGLPQYWDSIELDARGPYASRELAGSAFEPARWEALEFVAMPNLADIEFRSGCSSPIATPLLVTVPNVAGLRADEAESRLRAAGLTAYLVGGAAPRSREEQYTIERQDPAANTRVEKGASVRVAVRPAFVDPGRAVPAVTGLTAAAAQQRLEAAGFVARVAGGDPAPTAERAFTVQDQRPEGGATASPGSTVVVRIFSKPDTERSVPNVVGLSAADADRRLREAGLVAMTQGGDPAPTSDAAFKVQSQQPAAGTTVEAGTNVRVRIHSAFVAAAQPPDPPIRTGGSEETALPAGADPNFFRCPSIGGQTPAPLRMTPQHRSARCPHWGYYRHDRWRFELVASWATDGPLHPAWKVTCGGPPHFEFRPATIRDVQTRSAETGEMVTYKIPYPATMTALYASQQRKAIVSITWHAPSSEPLPPELQDVVRQVMAETEWRGRRCDGTGPAPPTATQPPPQPAPVRQPAPAPVAPVNMRPPCTCKDAAGRSYRMLFDQACDPNSLSRDDNCTP